MEIILNDYHKKVNAKMREKINRSSSLHLFVLTLMKLIGLIGLIFSPPTAALAAQNQ